MFAESESTKVKVPELFTESLIVANVVSKHDRVNVPWKSALFVVMKTTALEDLEAFGTNHKANVFHLIIGDCGGIVEAVAEFEVRVKIVFSGEHLLARCQARVLSWSKVGQSLDRSTSG